MRSLRGWSLAADNLFGGHAMGGLKSQKSAGTLKKMAGEGGGVTSESFIDGSNPLNHQLALFLVQTIAIVVMSRLCAHALKLFNQPAVIAEVVGGILLGPTALGRIPEFKSTLFPEKSMPLLSLVGNFGLVLYLFLVGMELDPRKVAKDFRKSWLISIAGIIIPFGGGVGVAKWLYDTYGEKQSIPFASFCVFIGVGIF